MLTALVKTAKRVPARKRMRAQVLLKVDQSEHGPAWTDEHVAEALDVHVNTVRTIRRALLEPGMEAALRRKPMDHPPRSPRLDGSGEQELIAIAQSDAPDGRARWTLHLLADRLVQLKVVGSISHETVRKTLTKTRSSPTSR